MVSFFGPVKQGVEKRVAASKSREKRSLFVPMLLGSIITGSFYAFPAKAANRFNAWEAAAAMAGGGLATLVCVAVQNQPGSAESLRKLVTNTDDFSELAARLDESMHLTHQKLDRQQANSAELNQNMARLGSSLSRADDSISRFSEGVYSMASGSFRQQQAPPAQTHYYEESAPEPVEPLEEINFEPAQPNQFEDEWS